MKEQFTSEELTAKWPDAELRARIDKLEGWYVEGVMMGADKLPSMLLGLSSAYEQRALRDWFCQKQIKLFKQGSFEIGLAYIKSKIKKPAEMAGAYAGKLLFALLSDNKELIHWHSQYFVPLFIGHGKRTGTFCDRTDKWEFFSLLSRLALVGDWPTLNERAEYGLANLSKRLKRHEIDFHFYIALSKGDISGMEQQIQELLKPKNARVRNQEGGFGLEQGLIHSWAVIYTKMAYYLGYELDVESVWIPKEWLPIGALNEYVVPAIFQGEPDIFTPFKNDPNSWCKNLSALSPRPLGEPPLTYNEVLETIEV